MRTLIVGKVVKILHTLYLDNSRLVNFDQPSTNKDNLKGCSGVGANLKSIKEQIGL